MTLLERAAACSPANLVGPSTTDRGASAPDVIVLPPTVPATAAVPHAEDLTVPERVITAPVAGLFAAAPAQDVTCEGEILTAGQVVGFVVGGGERVVVRSPFDGFFMGRLAHDGERVRPGQPLAWLRVIAP